MWCITRVSLLTKSSWRKLVLENKIKEGEKAQSVDHSIQIKPANDLPLSEARKILRLKGPTAHEFNLGHKGRSFGHWLVAIEYYWISFTFLLSDPTFKYFLVYILLSVLGFRVSPIFYSFHLLDVINRFPTLKNVIQAVTLNSD